MSLLNLFSNQLGEVIEWEDQPADILWYRHPSARNEIKNASKLIVGPGQGCVLVYEGKVIQTIAEEGIFNLKTGNHPFITSLIKMANNFESEHKMFVYFYRRAEVLNQPWGTATPIKYVDAVYGFPINLGVNGSFSYKISEVSSLFKEVIGSKAEFSTLDMKDIIVSRFPQIITSFIAGKKLSYTQIDAELTNMGKELHEQLHQQLQQLGLTLTDIKINGTQFDNETQQRIGKIANMTTEVFTARQAGLDFAELERLKALRDAARNEGGVAGAGLQMGVGMELGRKFNEQKEEIVNHSTGDIIEKLRKLQILLSENIITEEEFQTKKKELLTQL